MNAKCQCRDTEIGRRDVTHSNLDSTDLALLEPRVGEVVVDVRERLDQLSTLGLSGLEELSRNVTRRNKVSG